MAKYLKFFLFLLGLGVIGFGSFSMREMVPPKKESTEMIASPAPVILEEDYYATLLESLETVTVAEKNYRFAYFKVINPDQLKLFTNHKEKKSAKALYEEKGCRFLTNGGFYSQENEPLGWLVSQGQILANLTESKLLNGFLSIADQGKVMISDIVPQGVIVCGLQSGPLLIFEGSTLPLAIKNDEPRRRMAAAINDRNTLYFLAITHPDSISSGPYLTDLPAVVAAIGGKIDSGFMAALNLDGGSASAFLSEELKLTELTFIGSYFCLQD